MIDPLTIAILASTAIEFVTQIASGLNRAIFGGTLNEMKKSLTKYLTENQKFAEQLQTAVNNKDQHLVNNLMYASPFGSQIQHLNNQAKDYQAKHSEAKNDEQRANESATNASNKVNKYENNMDNGIIGFVSNIFTGGKAQDSVKEAGQKSSKYGESVQNFVTGNARSGHDATTQRLKDRSIPSTLDSVKNQVNGGLRQKN